MSSYRAGSYPFTGGGGRGFSGLGLGCKILGNRAHDPVARVPGGLLDEGGNQLPIGFPQALVGRRHLVFDGFMQLGQRVEGGHWHQVMLGMVLHIHVQEGENGVYVDGARVLAVVVRVFTQAGVLGQAKELLQPAPIESGQKNEHHGQEAAYSQRPDGKSGDYSEMDAAGPVHFGKFPLRHKVKHVGVRTAEGVANQAPDFGGPLRR